MHVALLFPWPTITGRCLLGVLKLHSKEVLGSEVAVCSKFRKILIFGPGRQTPGWDSYPPVDNDPSADFSQNIFSGL